MPLGWICFIAPERNDNDAEIGFEFRTNFIKLFEDGIDECSQ
jgi:hypothetical protein